MKIKFFVNRSVFFNLINIFSFHYGVLLIITIFFFVYGTLFLFTEIENILKKKNLIFYYYQCVYTNFFNCINIFWY